MSLIESILNETNTSNVVSEQHDPNRIDTGGGAAASLQQRIDAIRKGQWDAAEYGISADEQIARLQATQGDPEALAKEDAILRQRALQRASLDTSTGKVAVMVAGVPPWHKLGVNVAKAVTSAEARVLASLDWTVSKRSLSFKHADEWKDQEETYAIVRDDTGACLGTVGSRYQPIQNDEGFGFLDDVLGEFGARYETAGAIHGGKKVWMLATLPKSAFKVGAGDEVVTYAIFTNPHDGSGQAYCYPTTERVVCANTFRVSTRDRGKGIGIRHTGSIKGKIESAKAALGLSAQGFSEFASNAALLARVRVKASHNYFSAVLDQVLDVSASDIALGAQGLAKSRTLHDISPEEFDFAVKTAERQIQTRAEIWEDIITRFDSEHCNVNGVGGTAWAAFNAVTEHADYANGKRHVGSKEAQASRKFESVLAGDADNLKQLAYREALALAV